MRTIVDTNTFHPTCTIIAHIHRHLSVYSMRAPKEISDLLKRHYPAFLLTIDRRPCLLGGKHTIRLPCKGCKNPQDVGEVTGVVSGFFSKQKFGLPANSAVAPATRGVNESSAGLLSVSVTV